MELQIEAVHEPQRPKLILGDFGIDKTLGLVAKLAYAIEDETVVELVIAVHGGALGLNRRKTAAGPCCLFPEILPDGGSERSDAFTDMKRSYPAIAPLGIEQIGPRHNIGCFGLPS